MYWTLALQIDDEADKAVTAYATHAILSGNALRLLKLDPVAIRQAG